MAFLILFPDLTVRANLYRPSGAAFFWGSVRRRSMTPHKKHVIPSRSAGPASSAVNFPVRTTAQDKKEARRKAERTESVGQEEWIEERSFVAEGAPLDDGQKRFG